MTLDEVIKNVESELVSRSVDAAKAALSIWVPGFLAWILTPVGNFVWKWIAEPVIRWVAKLVVKQLDNAGYYLYKTVTNNADAVKFQDTIRDEKAAVESGNSDAILKARADKRAAFTKLFPLTA